MQPVHKDSTSLLEYYFSNFAGGLTRLARALQRLRGAAGAQVHGAAGRDVRIFQKHGNRAQERAASGPQRPDRGVVHQPAPQGPHHPQGLPQLLQLRRLRTGVLLLPEQVADRVLRRSTPPSSRTCRPTPSARPSSSPPPRTPATRASSSGTSTASAPPRAPSTTKTPTPPRAPCTSGTRAPRSTPSPGSRTAATCTASRTAPPATRPSSPRPTSG